MAATEQALIAKCKERCLKQLEWERIDREGETFHRQLMGIQSQLEIMLIDIDIMSYELVKEEQ